MSSRCWARIYFAALHLKLVPKIYLLLRRRSICCVCILNGDLGYGVVVGVGDGDGGLFVLYEECSFSCQFEDGVVDALGVLV